MEKADWDVMYTVFSKHGKYRVTAINEDARTVIKLYDAKTNQPVALPALPEGDVTVVRISPSEQRMAFYASSDTAPRNLYVHDFTSGKTTRLTDTLSKQIDPDDLVDAQVVRFKSFDGMEIPNILYKPHQATRAAPRRRRWSGCTAARAARRARATARCIQYLVNHGYVVLGINNRGSSRLRQDLLHRGRPQARHASRCGTASTAKKYLQSLPYVDGQRIGIIGGSYGGYMMLAALAFQPDGVQRRRRHLRRLQLAAHPGEHPALLGELPQGAVPGDRRPGEADAEMLRATSPAVPRGQDPAAAARAAGRQRPARHQAGVATRSSRR